MAEILLKVALNTIAITLSPNHVTLFVNFRVFIIRSSYHINHIIAYFNVNVIIIDSIHIIKPKQRIKCYMCHISKLERNRSSIKPKIKESRQPYRVE
jgi:hypothetical protein